MKKLMYIPLAFMLSTSSLLALSKTSTSEAEITNTVMTINAGEINLAKLAEQKATNPQVKKFAEQMLGDHSRGNEKIDALSYNENLAPKETQESIKIKTIDDEKVSQLQKLKGNEFDKAYMTSQIEMHKQALNKINKVLLPNAKDEQLRAMLDKTKSEVQKHLKDAEAIRLTL